MEKPNAHSLSGLLSRLCKDQSGNVIAIAAAATLPLIGIVGGAVDMSRVYAVRIGMQAACDASALAGRKTMGNGTWTTAVENIAQKVFSANIKNTAFGSTVQTPTFTNTNGLVTGSATAAVPMTLMAIFGVTSKSVTVTCTSNMRIAHTDIMFVLDTTGSMNCAPGDTIDGAGGTPVCTNNGGVEKVDARIKGLRSAVNCFVETMAKADTGEVCAASGSDPAPIGLSSSIQLRVGFVPYSSNVNVGKLLPTAYFADSRTFQSREPITNTVQTWQDSGASNLSAPSAWSGATRPASYNTSYISTSSFQAFSTDLGTTTGTFTVNVTGGTATTLNRRITGATSANCANNNTYSTTPAAANRIRALGDSEGAVGSPSYGSYSAPTYPAANHSRTNTESRTNTLLGYRYIWHASSSTCRLYQATGLVPSTNWTQSRNVTETQPITWTAIQELTGWTLKPKTLDVSGFKNGTSWNDWANVPNAGVGSATVKKSGSNSSTTISIPASQSVNWTGCIEERQTYLNTDADPSDEWSPIPSTAIDMDIDRAPDAADETTKWGFALPGLIYARYDGSGNRTTANNTTGTDSSGNALNTLACPAQAKKLTMATDAADATRKSATNIKAYTDSLIATGGTYHDVGLLWGARLLSSTGIFASENALDSSGNAITRQRHVVFMTDGGTGTCSWSYTPYGVSWWDRRQTNKANPDDDGVSSCSNSYTNQITDARTAALCNEIKNTNTTIWVVSFGLGVDAATKNRLTQCASSANHFYDANSTAGLKTAFEEIALQISRLRLQN